MATNFASAHAATAPLPHVIDPGLATAIVAAAFAAIAAWATYLWRTRAARTSTRNTVAAWCKRVAPRREPKNPQLLAEELATSRKLEQTRRNHDVQSRRAAADHRLALDTIDEDIADAREQRSLSALYRTASVSGARARMRAQINESAEARGLRVAAVRRWTLRVGIVITCAFGVWSTSGVHSGVTALLALEGGSVGWWAAWLVEPALTAVVALIIVVRSVLRASGGDTDTRATRIMWGALSLSVVLNAAGDWPTEFSAATVGALVAHSVGPVGAAGTAHLISIIDDYVACARPWDDAPSVEQIELGCPVQSKDVPPADAENSSRAGVLATEVPVGDLPGWEPWDGPDPEGDAFWEAITEPAPQRPSEGSGAPVRSSFPQPHDPFLDAVDECRFAIVTTGRPISERKLADKYRKPDGAPMGRRWARRVRARAAVEATELCGGSRLPGDVKDSTCLPKAEHAAADRA
ncbi:hypothetical protein HNR23_002183 [Nocardiopsis mwathae]|uniref:DUF2637 domain-containing protein n=1 Tax=Nocardiopsis mwathae TaxID=1472723 RepID=A0A7W9YHA8_9ACTN|nr:hypothetical protein [Nocardiopsis mwathae]